MAETMDSQLPTAKELMEEVRMTFSPGMDLMAAIEQLAKMGMSAAPVVDSQDRFVGMLTEKDCLRILSVGAFHRPRSGRVADLLSKVEQVLEVDMDIFHVSKVFLSNNFPMLPVLDRDSLVGCITRQHMLNGIMALDGIQEAKQRQLEDDAKGIASRPRAIAEMQRVFAKYSKAQLVSRLGRKG